MIHATYCFPQTQEVEFVDVWENQIWIKLHNGGSIIIGQNSTTTKYSGSIMDNLCNWTPRHLYIEGMYHIQENERN